MARGTILVVDDDPVVVDLLRLDFEIEGYEVLAAADGESALEEARVKGPDVVVLDVVMPGVDGLEVARRLRAGDETGAIPIVLLSAKAQAVDIQAGRAVADDYITKPFEPIELLDRVAELRARSSRGGGGRGGAR